jgi:hypothetical protein
MGLISKEQQGWESKEKCLLERQKQGFAQRGMPMHRGWKLMKHDLDGGKGLDG